MDPELRVPLKKEGHMRRDPRKLERKKTWTAWGLHN